MNKAVPSVKGNYFTKYCDSSKHKLAANQMLVNAANRNKRKLYFFLHNIWLNASKLHNILKN